MTDTQEKKDILILTGPSGAGKTALKEYLLENFKPDFQKFITSTTRSMRPGEQHGVDYYFRQFQDFSQMIQNKEVFEHEEVFPGKMYGCEYDELIRITQSHKTPVLTVDVNGALKFLGKSSTGNIDLSAINPIVFYISSSLETLIARVKKDNELGKRNDNEIDLNERFRRMGLELGLQTEFDNIVINDNRHQHLTGNELVNKIFEKLKTKSHERITKF